MKERDEELVLFLEMRRREMEKNDQFLLLDSSDELDASLGSYEGDSMVSEVVQSAPVRKTAAQNFLDSENEKSDYDWLLTPPETPLFPSLEKEPQKKTLMSQNRISTTRATVLKSRLENLPEEPAPRKTLSPKQGPLPIAQNSSSTRSVSNKRPSSSGVSKSASRPSTPTSRSTLPAATKPSRSSTPTSRATLPSTKPAPSSARSSTPTSRASLPSTKPAPSARSSTPTRSTARSSTPTARPSITTTKSTLRSATPTRRPTTPSSAPTASKPSAQSSALTKSAPAPSKNPFPSRGTSPTVRSRPLKPSDMPGFSNDAPPNLRTSLPQRPASASRGRPGAPSAKSSSVDPSSNGKPRRQSCSPSRSRTSNGTAHSSVNSIRPGHRVDPNNSDSDSPVVMGNKMVERVVNMRKLAPPKHDYEFSNHRNPSAKLSTSMDSTGFGRTLSKKSLDMAIRHMGIRKTISGNQRPHVTNVPASSIYSVRSSSSKSKSVSVTDSPHATSSNCSEPSVNNNPISLDGCEIDQDHDLGNERGNTSSIAS